MKFRSDIDGLRALAVVPVVLFHAGISAMSGGYIGVDVFFVISGYLITGIMQSEIREGRFSILSFYERRIRRILPALAFTIFATLICSLFFFLPSYLEDFGKSLISTSTFLSNVYFYKYSGYFENDALLRPMLHTWSLAVEEQFYIFMPLALWLAHRYLTRRWALVFALIALASFALSLFMTTRGPTANFFLLPTRAWELLLGALLAMAPPPPVKSYALNSLLAAAGVVMIIWPVFVYSDATPFPGLAAVPPCLGAAILIYAGLNNKSLVNSAIGWAPLVFIGQLSYSLYLVHWPITVFVRYLTLRQPDVGGVLLIVGLSFALALVSWRWVERPFRNRAFIASRTRLFGLAGVVLAAIALSGTVLVAAHGLPQRFPGAKALIAEPTTGDPSEGRGWRNGTCFFLDVSRAPKWSKDRCLITHPAARSALLWGDSFAAHYTPGIAANAGRIPFQVYQYNMAGCPPVLSYYSYARPACQAFNRNAIQIIRMQGIKTVVLSGRWEDLKSRGIDQLASTLQALDALGVKTYVIGQSPDFLTRAEVIAFLKGSARARGMERWVDAVDPAINQELRKEAGATHPFIDPMKALCVRDNCVYRIDGKLLYTEKGHLTSFGSQYAVQLYFPLYQRP